MPGALGPGVTGGMLETQLDLQNIQMGQYKLAEAPLKLQEEQIQLKRDTIQLQQQVRMLNLMQNLRPPKDSGPDGMADLMNQMSILQMEAGNPEEARKLAATGSKLLEDASKIDQRTYKMQNDRLSKFSNILDATQDSPGGWAAAIQAMVSADPGVTRDQRFVQLAQQPWRPGLIEGVKRSVLTAKDQAEVTYRQKAGAHAESAATVDEARIGLIKAQEDYYRQRVKTMGKEGVLKVKAATLKAVTDMAEAEYPGGDPADIRVRSRPLAEEATRLMREQHLTESEAVRRAYEAARSGGVFTGLRQAPVMKGSKPGNPLPLPKDAKSIQQNQWYLVNGQPMVAMGSKFYTEQELAAADREDEEETEGEEP